jgi:splicing factor U2AF 65 kDa subunit
MELGDRYLVVQRASLGAGKDLPGGLPFDLEEVIPKPIMPATATAPSVSARILLMLNMVVAEDLMDPQDYDDILEDVREECSKYGQVEDLRVPRPTKRDKGAGATGALEAQRADEAAGVGRVYIKYVDSDGANAALNSLAGRSFGGRSIIATLLSDDSQTTPPLSIIFGSAPPPPPPV